MYRWKHTVAGLILAILFIGGRLIVDQWDSEGLLVGKAGAIHNAVIYLVVFGGTAAVFLVLAVAYWGDHLRAAVLIFGGMGAVWLIVTGVMTIGSFISTNLIPFIGYIALLMYCTWAVAGIMGLIEVSRNIVKPLAEG